MRRYVWMTGLVVALAGTAIAQQPRDDADEPRGRRGRDAQEDRDDADDEGGRRGRGRGDGQYGRGDGQFGRGGGGPGGMFRRPNPMFQAIDVNGDEVISETELRRAVTALKKLDADSDGNITVAEASPQGGPGGPFGDTNQMVDRWMENDANGDGKLQVDEVPERMAWMLQGADQNNDQAVDRAELEQVLGRMRERFQGGGPGGGPGGGRFGPGGGPGGDPSEWARNFDRNNDGRLTPDEVPPPVADMLRTSNADANGDGAVDANELRDAARRMGERAGGGRGFGPGGPGGRGDNDDRGGRGRRGGRDAEDDDRPRRPESE
jgi:Ca2+-binding EF-hand superfamily protein